MPALEKVIFKQTHGPRKEAEIDRSLIGKNASYILQKAPGAMAFLGAAPEGGDYRTCCALHSNRMVLEESVMARGVAMHCAMAQAMLIGEGLRGVARAPREVRVDAKLIAP